MREIRTLEGRRGVVLGAPFYIGHWPKEAQRFLSEHRDALTQRPVATFALGPLSAAEQEMLDARDQLDKELKNYPWLTPVDTEMFIGKYEPAKLSFWHRIIAALPASPLHGRPASDLRDWTAIRAWASDVAQKFQPVSSR
jgi:menaquinone-dependent protoporphyrinogen oxidase